MSAPETLGHIKYLKDVEIDGAIITGPFVFDADVTFHHNIIFDGAGPQDIIINQPVYVLAGTSDIFDLSNVQSSAFNLQPRSSIPTNNPTGSKRLWYGNSVATPVGAQNRLLIENNVIAYISDIIAAFTDATLKGDTKITGGGPGLNQLTVSVPSFFNGNITATNNGSTYTFHSVILQPRASNPVVSTTDLWFNTSAPLQPGLFLGNKLIPAQEVLSMNWTLTNPNSPAFTLLLPVVVTKTGTKVQVEFAINTPTVFRWALDGPSYPNPGAEFVRLQPTGMPVSWMPLANTSIGAGNFVVQSVTGASMGNNDAPYGYVQDVAIAWEQSSSSWGFASVTGSIRLVEQFTTLFVTTTYNFPVLQIMPTSFVYSAQPYL